MQVLVVFDFVVAWLSLAKTKTMMEDRSSLFSLSLDSASKEHLTEAAKWARFLAIVGFIFLGLLVLSGFAASAAVSRFNDEYTGSRGMAGVLGATTAVTYIIVAIVYFFPLLYLLRFANAAREAIASNDQERLAISFQNLKAMLRYVGIVTIIGLVFMFIGILMVFAGTALSS